MQAHWRSTISVRMLLYIGVCIVCWLFGQPGNTQVAATGAVISSAAGTASGSISAGGYHTCAIKADGTIACWGPNPYGEATPPDGTFTQVSAGFYHTCAIKTDGTLACWGDNRLGQLTNIPTGTFTQVSAGDEHTCGIKTDGTLACWGFNLYGQTNAPAGTFTQVSAGFSHTCAVKTDSTISCWGDNNSGQSTPPTGTFTQVSAGPFHTCAVKTDGTIACWGDNFSGAATPPTGTFTQVSASYYYTCALATEGTVACWGRNAFGQTDAPAGTFTQVTSGSIHACALKTDGTIACWGDNYFGETDAPSGSFSHRAVSAGFFHSCEVRASGTLACWGRNDYGEASPPAGTFTQVSAGEFYTCAIKTNGTLICWGINTVGQASPPFGTFTQITAGFTHACAIRTGGTLACWGGNFLGQLNNIPTGTFTQVSAGGYHTCAIKTDGTLACWGDNSNGQATPPAGTFTQVSAGLFHTCAVKTDGTLACWGYDEFGQTNAPAGTFREVSGGGNHTCAIKTGGMLECWGLNDLGETYPQPGTFMQISTGFFHTCALMTNGIVTCWGNDFFGQTNAPNPPVFSTQPADAALTVGNMLTLSVTASGNPAPTYQWYYGTTPIPLATDPTYTVNSVTTANAGSYYVVVSNSEGDATSNTAAVTVAKATPVLTWNTPAAITYGTALSVTQLDATASFNGNPVPGTFTYTPPMGTILNAGPNQTLSVNFAPTDSTNFTTPVPGSTAITVTKASQSITFAAIPGHTFGDAPFQASATGGASGNPVTFSASGDCTGTSTNPTTIAFTGAGSCTVNADQAGNANYSAAPTVSHTFTIAKATLVLAWPAPSSIIYGTALSALQLDATAPFGASTILGTYVYSPSAGAVLHGGVSQPLTVSFTPRDTTDFNSPVSGSTTITVNRATPIVTWHAPAAITYGTPLDTIQLDATAAYSSSSVLGTFTYTPPAGTKLNAGVNQALSVSFAPTDSADYSGPVLNSTTITVNKAPSSTALTSGANPASIGQTITFTAHVTFSAGTPTGSATFYDTTSGSVFLGNGTLAGGVATFSTNILTAGTHSIVATYQGDTNFLASQSTVLTQTVATCSVSAFLLEGLQGTFNASVAGKPGIVNTNIVQFSGSDGSFRLSNTAVTFCANPGTASGSAVIIGTVIGTPTGPYQVGDHISITILAIGSGGGPEVDISNTTHAHSFALKTVQGGIGSVKVTTP